MAGATPAKLIRLVMPCGGVTDTLPRLCPFAKRLRHGILVPICIGSNPIGAASKNKRNEVIILDDEIVSRIIVLVMIGAFVALCIAASIYNEAR